MKEYIYKFTETIEAHIVDEELLQCLQRIMQDENESSDFCLEVNCGNGIRYDFSDVDEMTAFSKNNLVKIDSLKMKCEYKIPGLYSTGRVEIIFHNESNRSFFESSCEVHYELHDEKSYFFLKEKIDSMLRSKKPMYSILSRVPLIWIADGVFYAVLCAYTWINGIVFPIYVQRIISYICFMVLFVPIFSLSRRIKLAVFPKNDFRFGLLERKSSKMAALRSYIWKGMILSIVVGLITNAASKLFVG